MNVLEIDSIADRLSVITKQSLKVYTVKVDDVIQNNLKNEQDVERILDGLLDICFDDEALVLFKRMCRYYLSINPHATRDYINYYKDMYEEDGYLESINE